ncbi:Sigma-E factor regulatory protein rseC [Leminorella richardii]|uniref:Sigma-E factor regulatory protein rseC n=1 Tax=Leminorella richardii TaxID=158841 RepID=A0A2X4V1A4_9GAMM|nr:SoxR-reducing system protein RseC [Leminorella richardii]SQI41938.1 Sigma-E factor regulatory protein rseC [Leminorella richardii]
MLHEWATVVDWRQGVATLRCEQRSGCSGCRSSSSCGTRVLSKLGPSGIHELKIEHDDPLIPGQRVALAIPESSLLVSALLVYTVPLLGILLFSSLFYLWLDTDLAAIGGAALGGLAGFITARFYANRLATKPAMRPAIVRVALPGVNVDEESA